VKEHCRQTLERAYLWLDGEVLSEDERLDIQRHLEECTPCFERVGLEREVMQVLTRLHGRHRCPETLRTKISRLFEA
jgi:mycothiol system anti-sigma-R factor